MRLHELAWNDDGIDRWLMNSPFYIFVFLVFLASNLIAVVDERSVCCCYCCVAVVANAVAVVADIIVITTTTTTINLGAFNVCDDILAKRMCRRCLWLRLPVLPLPLDCSSG